MPSEQYAELANELRRDLDSMRRSRDELSARHDAFRADMEKLRAEKALAILQGRALELADVVKYARSSARAHAVLNRSMSHRSQAEALSMLADELEQGLHRPAKP